MNQIKVVLFLSFSIFTMSLPSTSNGKPLDVTKERQRLGGHFKNLRVHYSAYGFVNYSYDALTIRGFDSTKSWTPYLCTPPLKNLLIEVNAQIVPLSQAKFDDVQIAYDCSPTWLWVRVSRKNKVMFKHSYNSDSEEELEKMFIRDLESEDVIE